MCIKWGGICKGAAEEWRREGEVARRTGGEVPAAATDVNRRGEGEEVSEGGGEKEAAPDGRVWEGEWQH